MRATLVIVKAGLSLHFVDRKEVIVCTQRAMVGHVASLVSLALAQQVSEPAQWQTTALDSTAQLLAPWIGMDLATASAASSISLFQDTIMKGPSAADWRIMNSSYEAIWRNDAAALENVACQIAARLGADTAIFTGITAQDMGAR